MLDLIDIGVNLAHRSFRSDLAQVIARATAAGVRALVITGTSETSSKAALEIARAHPGALHATAGVHPHDARRCGDGTIDALRALAAEPEVVAIGECGLDYDRDFSPRPVQDRWFEEQIRLACELGMPLFLHERAAHARFLEILRPHRPALAGAVVHCFTGGLAELEAYLALDLHIGVTGWICDERRGADLRAAVARVPLDRLLLETDAPFLTPRDLQPRPPKGRNEPAFLPHVLSAVARCMGRAPEEVAASTTATARRLFGLGAST